MLGAHAEVHVGDESFVHAFLDTEIEHGFLFSVVDARHLGQVALLVVGFDLVDDAGGQVLQSRLGVAGHELLAVYEDLLHFLSVDFDASVVAHLSTRQALHELFDGGAFGCAISRRVVHEGVFLEHHFLSHGGDGGGLEHDGLCVDVYLAHGEVFALAHHDASYCGLVSYAGYLEQIAAVFGSLEAEESILVADGARDIGAVCT